LDVEQLFQLLASDDPGTRIKAAAQAAGSGEPRVVGPLARRLKIESDVQVKLVLVESLGRLKVAEGLQAVRSTAADPAGAVRSRVLETLFNAQDETVFPLAVKMVSDLDPQVRQVAFQIVRRLGKDGVLQIIGKMLNGEDVRWKVHAVAALGQLATGEGVALLARCLTHDAQEVRMQARSSLLNLAKHGHDAAVQILRNSAPGGAVAGPGVGNATLVTASPDAARRSPAAAAPGAGPTDTLVMAPLGPTSLGVGVAGAAAAAPARDVPPVARPATSASAATVASAAAAGSGGRAAFVPIDEHSLRINVEQPAQAPLNKRFSTAKYKALFGESMPRLAMTDGPPEAPGGEGGAAAGPAGAAAAVASDGECPHGAAPDEGLHDDVPGDAHDGGSKKKNPRDWKDNVCRECSYVRKDRPDKAKMAPQRMWCSLLKKETSASKTCPRGKWT
jgi:hypothetical protein